MNGGNQRTLFADEMKMCRSFYSTLPLQYVLSFRFEWVTVPPFASEKGYLEALVPPSSSSSPFYGR